ncbi:hypothetical protein M2390_003085 [Mycetocola sp. BIGb0189]|uniref:hypothetical protein n=1 Tax=Mycetocola sp. BIGb0189 TaxID=2940604 RepID=UPI002169142D|nr:hypothetical protein [Mycetocola sp. BIGb0189]MCS4277869.1 hypothetical protein [Mycetocola sp. BIGb0189]
MTTVSPFPRVLRRTAVLLLGALIALAGLVSADPAHAASSVSVSGRPALESPTQLSLSGRGFQSLPNAPGGIYVFFGAVSTPGSNAWAPSQGGSTGVTYNYAGTGGAQLLVSFPGGSSASQANGQMDAAGNWNATITVPGLKFAAKDRNDVVRQVDCGTVQCGIITIGAHGQWNANNETFTPVNFAEGTVSYSDAPVEVPAVSTIEGASEAPVPAAEEPSAEPSAAAAPAASPSASPRPESAAQNSGADGASVLVIGVLAASVLALAGAGFTVWFRRRAVRTAHVTAPEEPNLEER